MRVDRAFVAGMLVVPITLACLVAAFAGNVTIPNTFVAGTVARAGEVNDNFTAVAAAVNDNDVRIDALVASAGATRVMSVSGSHFQPYDNASPFQNILGTGGAWFTGGAHWMAAPVHLPHGATVTRFTVYFDDTSAADMDVNLVRQGLDGSISSVNLATLSSDTNTGFYSKTTTAIVPSQAVINNQNSGYAVSAFSLAWESDLKLKGAVIEYTLP